MVDKITSIAGLKKAIEGKVWIGVGTTEDILRLINSFEASVRGRIKSIQNHLKVKDYPQKSVSVVVDEAVLEELEKELNIILEGTD